jgi:periplasmic protein TonB
VGAPESTQSRSLTGDMSRFHGPLELSCQALSPDRNLLKSQAPLSLNAMALRALVFSSDGSTTSALCHVLTDLGIEAEICSEMLVAVERITSQPYNALLVDWDQQAEAIFLVKQLRELKLASQALTLALVENDEDLPQALQAGANSVIRKPIDSQQARDTLSTAKQLILARQVEPRAAQPASPEPRAPEPPPVEQPNDELPVVPEQTAPIEGPFAIDDPVNFEAVEQNEKPKRGFLQQTAPRSALEAEQVLANSEPQAPEPQPAPPAPVPVPDPAIRERALSILGYGANPEPKSAPRSENNGSGTLEDFAAPNPVKPREPRSQDLHQEFSSLPEDFDQTQDEQNASRSHKSVYAVAAAVLIACSLWVLAPGNKYVARLKDLQIPHLQSSHAAPAVPTNVPRSPVHASTPKAEDPVLPDPALTESQDEASSNVQVIENKPIPIAGAQQPPTSDAPPDAQPVTTADTPPSPEPTPTTSTPPATVPAESAAATSHPQLQPATATQVSSSSAPPAPVAVPLPPAKPTDSALSDTGSRPAVIIPDSLKNSPSASSMNSLEPPIVPEETSRSMLLNKVDPEYPPIAIPQRLEGTVILQVFVSPDGNVRDIKLVRGYFLLGKAAFDAVHQWRFKPYSQNGKPTEFQTYVTLNFKLPS